MCLTQKPGYKIFATSIVNIEKTLAPKKYTNLATKVPAEYHGNLKAFSQTKVDKLPEYQSYNLKIKLKSRKQLPFSSLYRMSQDELKCLQKYLDKYLVKGFIQTSILSIATPILFAKKPGGSL